MQLRFLTLLCTGFFMASFNTVSIAEPKLKFGGDLHGLDIFHWTEKTATVLTVRPMNGGFASDRVLN